ncbi:hypothetical protein [Ruminococcus sp.]|uniref:hypothetical protein n=1 Tax=Ruminococcus sp. TaxID=41978 RepID=UPI0025EA8A4A|nr:hypothetical protein [Ruminococcus sp.]
MTVFFIIIFPSSLNSIFAVKESYLHHTKIIAHQGAKVNQNESKSACPATSDQLGGIAADLDRDALDSVCHAVSPPP